MKIVLLVLAIATAALGQVSTGSIFGTIQDESGGAVSAAEVTAEREATVSRAAFSPAAPAPTVSRNSPRVSTRSACGARGSAWLSRSTLRSR